MTTHRPAPLPISDFDYPLPPERIAQVPIEPRDAARLLVLGRTSGALHHQSIRDLPRWLADGDLVVANSTRVIPARLHGTKHQTGGAVELLLLHRLSNDVWRALAKPVRRLREGTTIALQPRDGASHADLAVEVVGIERDGEVLIRAPDLTPDRLGLYGTTPLPPYIRSTLADEERYQTLHATVAGSAAAPTAGLHVTPALRQALRQAGIGWAEVTLHVGLDTFRPVTVADLNDHHIHEEWYSALAETLAVIRETRARGNRVVALGTTSARTLETIGRCDSWLAGDWAAGVSGDTDLFIRPGYEWTMVDALITNFHLPRSTLLVMVSALAGRERVLNAYHVAIEEEYRFFSFGDAMLII